MATKLATTNCPMAILKGQLTRFENFMSNINDDTTSFDIKARFDKMPQIYNKFLEIQETSTSSTSLQEFEDRYFRLQAQFEAKLHNLSIQVPSFSANDSRSSNVSRSEPRNKLPPISLPKFEGLVSQWYSFHDTFISLVHNDPNIDNIKKFHYLKSCLTAESSNIIDSIPVTADNYESAWKSLVDRYNNKKLLVNYHLKGLFDLPSLRSENCSELRNLLDCANKHLRALKALNLEDNELPEFSMLENFIEKRCFALSNQVSESDSSKFAKITRPTTHLVANSNKTCNICNSGNHKTFKCSRLLALSPKERFDLIRQKKLCLKCFGKAHTVNHCSWGECKTCNKGHNTLLHFSEPHSAQAQINSNLHTSNISNQVILATALVRIEDKIGNFHTCRALLDSGSQSNFITRKLANHLGLKLLKSDIRISGINMSNSKTLFTTDCSISSAYRQFHANGTFLVTHKITQTLPAAPIDIKEWSFLKQYHLADPTFFQPGIIDILLGAEFYDDILLPLKIKLSPNLPSLRSTVFGWIVIGKLTSTESLKAMRSVTLCAFPEISTTLQRFWEIEEFPQENVNQNSFCEQSFISTVSRLPSGRIQVRLPLEPSLPEHNLGKSKHHALRMLILMENRRKRDDELNASYIKFMQEYERLNHMEIVHDDMADESNSKIFYLPHHAVFKKINDTKKIRVVFNGSAKSSNGRSLNDILALGPTIQDDLFTLLCRFRLYAIVLVADVEKMYRQVSLAPDDRDLCRILWRSNFDEPIKTYRLSTVTYGTKSASFLAIRSLHFLADSYKTTHPVAAHALKNDFYVDNLVTGSNSIEGAQVLLDQMIYVTNAGCMPLRQWCSNRPELLKSLADSIVEPINFSDSHSSAIPLLGLHWQPTTDTFQYTVHFAKTNHTKRTALSAISRIFDPLGFLSPIVIKAKIFLQQLWLSRLDWDTPFNSVLSSSWNDIYYDLTQLSSIQISRSVSLDCAPEDLILHIFSDASQAAYACVAYIESITKNNDRSSRLFCSKTRVAPLKPLTIPRLELCGLFISAKLAKKIVSSVTMVNHVYIWSDSQIALSWVRSPARNWKVFVSNRVSTIHELLKDIPHSFKYVPTEHNPADLASRGLPVRKILNHTLWWSGPSWLITRHNWPPQTIPINKAPDSEARTTIACIQTIVNNSDLNDRFSTYTRSIRVIAYCYRFLRSYRKESFPSWLTTLELRHSLNALIKMHQGMQFANDLISLKSQKSLQSNSKLINLNPFIDQEGILRVGGRLRNSEIPFTQKHPIILYKHGQLTNNVIDYIHQKHFHSGCQLTASIIGDNYWIIGAKSAIKKRIYNCTTCIRLRAQTLNQIMGDLPKDRLIPSRPFARCGVDYAGPFMLKRNKGRCNVLEKAYMALFVCFSTRALHLELVSDLTDEAFIAALKRFISRRGKPNDIYSDNGRNFLGARNKFEALKKFITK
ncbi:uncharacterized protein LOC122524512 [Polistes fuscatus]|uniref:uncharacterized protein LOC122524512 n=1 Tax=Polistes fuscatus TaxID=30207 RepID=UPI001CA8DF22|nr:uncharacterized protein LOC122524512 [Polistes fuscatus]